MESIESMSFVIETNEDFADYHRMPVIHFKMFNSMVLLSVNNNRRIYGFHRLVLKSTNDFMKVMSPTYVMKLIKEKIAPEVFKVPERWNDLNLTRKNQEHKFSVINGCTYLDIETTYANTDARMNVMKNVIYTRREEVSQENISRVVKAFTSTVSVNVILLITEIKEVIDLEYLLLLKPNIDFPDFQEKCEIGGNEREESKSGIIKWVKIKSEYHKISKPIRMFIRFTTYIKSKTYNRS